MYDQGFVLYETIVRGKGNHLFNVTFRDFMLIYVEKKICKIVEEGI